MDPDPGSISETLILSEPPPGVNALYYFVILGLLLLSAMTSAAEVAFFSLTRIDLDEFKETGSRSGRVVLSLLTRPKRLLATILIFNNLVNIGIILLSTYILNQLSIRFGWNQHEVFSTWILPVIQVGLVTFILLFFGEVTPKVYASQNRKRIALVGALPMKLMVTVFTPISWPLIKSTAFLDKRIRIDREAASFEEIKYAIDITSAEESPEEEKEILRGIVNFGNTYVRSIMRARVDIKAVDISFPFSTLLETVNEYGYSRLPVYDETPDHIRGILVVKDLLPLVRSGTENPEWAQLIRPAYFIPETKKIDDLLEEFKNMRLHIAVVVDEFGGTAGIVTLEDIIEEIFGEINDEFDEVEQVYSRLSDSEFVFEGKIPLNDLIRITGIPDEAFSEVKGEPDSIAGLVLELCGKLPAAGDVVEFENYRFHVESVSRRRIKRIKFVILNPETETPENESE